ncbi:MAG: hypothetical protein ACYDCH_12685 [Gaiellaceae bacterium]
MEYVSKVARIKEVVVRAHENYGSDREPANLPPSADARLHPTGIREINRAPARERLEVEEHL